MMPNKHTLAACSFLLLLLCVLSVPSLSSGLSVSNIFQLRRKNVTTLDHSISHDRLRLARRLLDSAASYKLYSGFYLEAGMFYTELRIGTPPSSYYVLVDTGSDVLWLNCESCTACRNSMVNIFNIPLTPYDPKLSSSSSVVECGDQFCALISTQPCSSSSNQTACNYSFSYVRGNSTGYIVRDNLQLDVLAGNQPASATITFGCATTVDTEIPFLDGILGLGPYPTSVISQLVAQNQTPPVFAHCLQASNDSSGGSLVIGNVEAAGLTYTPMIQSPGLYQVNLLSIGVNGRVIPVHSSLSPSNILTGTILDSGTTLVYFPDYVYGPLRTEVLGQPGVNCKTYGGSIDAGFPDITLTFEGNATMVLKPKDYLMNDLGLDNTWCIVFQNSKIVNLNLTILGDVVLMEKLVIYDQGQNKIGWVDYDCSSMVTTTS